MNRKNQIIAVLPVVMFLFFVSAVSAQQQVDWRSVSRPLVLADDEIQRLVQPHRQNVVGKNMLGGGMESSTGNSVPGIISVRKNADYSQNREILFTTTQPVLAGSVFIFSVALPNRAETVMQSIEITRDLGDSTMGVQLWDGNFPGIWPSGITSFRVYYVGGKGMSVLEVGVPVYTNFPYAGPIQLGAAYQDGNYVVLKGNFPENGPIEIAVSWHRVVDQAIVFRSATEIRIDRTLDKQILANFSDGLYTTTVKVGSGCDSAPLKYQQYPTPTPPPPLPTVVPKG